MKKETKDNIQYSFAAIVISLLFVIVILLLFVEIPEKNKDVINIGIGVVLGWGTMIIAYFFGSSKGSADKNDLIRNANTKTNGDNTIN